MTTDFVIRHSQELNEVRGDPCSEDRLVDDLGASGNLRCRFENDTVAGGQSSEDPACRNRDRKVPRGDNRDDSEWGETRPFDLIEHSIGVVASEVDRL